MKLIPGQALLLARKLTGILWRVFMQENRITENYGEEGKREDGIVDIKRISRVLERNLVQQKFL